MKHGVVIVLIVTAVTATSGGAATLRPTLGLADREPVTISLRGFQAHEIVKITLQDTSRASKTVLTTMSGRGLARFRSQYRDGCAIVRAVASGNKGSRARLMPKDLACPPLTP